MAALIIPVHPPPVALPFIQPGHSWQVRAPARSGLINPLGEPLCRSLLGLLPGQEGTPQGSRLINPLGELLRPSPPVGYHHYVIGAHYLWPEVVTPSPLPPDLRQLAQSVGPSLADHLQWVEMFFCSAEGVTAGGPGQGHWDLTPRVLHGCSYHPRPPSSCCPSVHPAWPLLAGPSSREEWAHQPSRGAPLSVTAWTSSRARGNSPGESAHQPARGAAASFAACGIPSLRYWGTLPLAGGGNAVPSTSRSETAGAERWSIPCGSLAMGGDVFCSAEGFTAGGPGQGHWDIAPSVSMAASCHPRPPSSCCPSVHPAWPLLAVPSSRGEWAHQPSRGAPLSVTAWTSSRARGNSPGESAHQPARGAAASFAACGIPSLRYWGTLPLAGGGNAVPSTSRSETAGAERWSIPCGSLAMGGDVFCSAEGFTAGGPGQGHWDIAPSVSMAASCHPRPPSSCCPSVHPAWPLLAVPSSRGEWAHQPSRGAPLSVTACTSSRVRGNSPGDSA